LEKTEIQDGCLDHQLLSPTYNVLVMLYHISRHQNRFVGWFMVFNATFNNISVISWRSALLVEETGENHRPAASH
jgi:ABC-type uncharacterized transport system permease subunit